MRTISLSPSLALSSPCQFDRVFGSPVRGFYLFFRPAAVRPGACVVFLFLFVSISPVRGFSFYFISIFFGEGLPPVCFFLLLFALESTNRFLDCRIGELIDSSVSCFEHFFLY
ncbi:hypothetical protein DFJ73DRAFT_129851 [Zopfochytrium polystomum]|nr:hypothetical protein DFJ73DRAFT_129851 [Zopfochytrium polystomum]